MQLKKIKLILFTIIFLLLVINVTAQQWYCYIPFITCSDNDPVPKQDINTDNITNIEEGKEASLYGYKYSNTSNLIMSSIQTNSCNWYPDNHPKKDLKTCEIIIEVINKNPIKLLNLTGQILSFLNQNRVTNYTITTEYSNYKDEFKLDNNESNKVNITRRKWANFNKVKAQETLNADFSIKAEFDMPKYETEQFNISLDIKYQGNIIQLNLDPDVGACGTLSSANSYYTLNSSINVSGTCFTIGANNITLDGGGYTITGNSTGSGITTAGYDALTIKNFGGINNFSLGVFASGTINSTIFNNTIYPTAKSGFNYGISLASSANNNNISNNNINLTGGNLARGIDLVTSSINNIISFNNITTSNANGYGIFLSSSSNTISANTITTTNLNGFGIYTSSSNSNNISTNTITTSGGSGYGMRLDTSSNNAISANTINTSNSNAYGIYLASSATDNNISFNNITTFGSSGIGIYLSSSTNNTLSTNAITTSSSSSFGIYIYSSSNNNTISTNTVTTTGSTSYGIILDASSNNILSTNNIKTTHATAAYGIYLYIGINNTFTDDNITSTGVNDIRIGSGSGTLTNVTFNKTDIGFDSGAKGNVTVQWYLDVIVQNTSGTALLDANVSIFNVSDIQQFNGLTAADGTIARQTLTDFYQDNTSKTFHTPHTVNTTLLNYITNSTIINITATSSTTLTVQLTPLYTFFFKVFDDNGLEVDSANVTVINSTYTFASCLTNTTGQCTVNDLTQPIAYNTAATKTGYSTGNNNTQTPNATGYPVSIIMVIQQGRIIRNLTDCSGNAINNSFITIKYTNGTIQEIIKTNGSGFANSSLLSTNIQWDLFYNNYSDFEESDVTPPSTKVFHEQCVKVINTNAVNINNAKIRIYRAAIATETQTVEGNTNSTGQKNFILDNTQEPFNFYCDDLYGSIGANFSKNIPATITCTVNTLIEDLLRDINRTTIYTNSTVNDIKSISQSNFTSIQNYLSDINKTVYNNNYNISVALSMITNVNNTVLQTNSSIMNYLINTIVQAYLSNNTIGLQAIKNVVDNINTNSSSNVWSSILANGQTANLTISNLAVNTTDVVTIIRTMMLGYKVDIQTPQFWYANNTVSFLVTVSDYIGRPVNPTTISANLFRDNLQDANQSLGNNISINVRNVYIGFYHINATINSTPVASGYYLEINTTLNNTNSITRQSFRITQSGPNRMAFILPDYCNTGENCNFQLDVTNEGNGDAEETFTCWFEDIYNGNNIVSQTSQQQLVKAQQRLNIDFSMPVPSYFKELNYYDIKCKYSIPNTEYQDMQPIESSLLIKAGLVTKTSHSNLWYYDRLGNLRFIPEEKIIEANYYKYLLYKRGQQRYLLLLLTLPLISIFIYRKHKINKKEKIKKTEKVN